MKKKLTTRSAPTAATSAGHTPPMTAAATTGTRYSSATLLSETLARAGTSSAVSAARPAAATATPSRPRRTGTGRGTLTLPLYGSAAGSQLPRHVGEQHATLEEQPGLQPQRALVVQYRLPPATHHVLGQIHHNQIPRMIAAQCGDVLHHRAGDVPVRGIQHGERHRDTPLRPLRL